MIKVFGIALFSQLLLILGGLGLLQIVSFRERIQWLSWVPFAWGIGVVILYFFGHLLVRTEWMVTGWHMVVSGVLLALTAFGIRCHIQAARGEPMVIIEHRPHWYDGLLLALILIKVGLVVYVNLVNSVIDSDAAYHIGYVGFAKKIGEGVTPSEVLKGHPIDSPWGPPLLFAWVRLFLDRWRDSVLGLPWLMVYLSSIGIVFTVCLRITRNLTASLACAYLFSAIPLAVMHAIRIGFNDLPVGYFFLMGMGFLTLAFLGGKKPDSLWLIIGITAILGSILTKMEGKMWAFWLGLIWLSCYLNRDKNIPWKRIFSVQIIMAVVLLTIYYWIGDELIINLGTRLGLLAPHSPRLELLVPHAFDPDAFRMTYGFLFGWGIFNIFWWFFFVLGVSLLIRKGNANVKALTVYLFSIVICIVYLSNFTANVEFTLVGTNVGRFFLHVTGLLLPLYCFYAIKLAPSLKPKREG